MSRITFIVPGQENAQRQVADLALPAGLTSGHIKHSVRIGAARGGAGDTRVSAVEGEDVVVLHIENGPVLVLHPANARDLLLGQSSVRRDAGAETPGDIPVPAQLRWQGMEESLVLRTGTTRGMLGDVLLSAVEIISGVAKDSAASLAASAVVARVDAQVDAGLYALEAALLPTLKTGGKKLAQVPAAPEGLPCLVLVHGTFSSTRGTFGKLWETHAPLVASLFQHYGNRVYALDHPTLGASPIANALLLARALPAGARLHLLTHSRGGLVAEVLTRVAADPEQALADFAPFSADAAASDRADLEALAGLVRSRGIRVERTVRVACPARGTLLASRRLDAYLSVFKWTLEAAGLPVMPEIVDFLAEVAQRRADPAVLPGLAAQMPDSPLIRWLHAVDDTAPGQLRVIAGDVEGDSVTSWLKTLLADAFYWTDNDLIVQTRSMYGGLPRAAGASYLLAQGGNVSHFRYFSNPNTARAIGEALMQDTPAGFRAIGPLSWAGASSAGSRDARFQTRDEQDAAARPAVIVLPGILGSNLKVGSKRIWLSWRLINGLSRLRYEAGIEDEVEPDGAIGATYDRLEEFLSATHEVIEFAYDWRVPMEEEARRLAGRVEEALKAREKSGQPVRFLAHSMGGLLARVMQLECPATWQKMMARPGARFLMLGTPNGGSWAPMQVLSGDDTFGNTLVAFGAPFQDHEARAMMAGLPGFIQLQAALLDGALGLDKAQTWQALADEDLRRVREHNWWHQNIWNDEQLPLSVYQWGVPPQAVLDRAVALRKRLDAQRGRDLQEFRNHLMLVTGKARFTPDGYELGREGLVYLDAQDHGDGRVTLASALLPGVRAWSLDCEHGKLPACREAFDAYLDLLERGDTARLPLVSAAETLSRGVPPAMPVVHVRSRPARLRAGTPPDTPRAIELLPGAEDTVRQPPAREPLRISVVNGNLKFVHHPLMLGHYRANRLTGSERVMDELIGGTMTASLRLGQYPSQPEMQRIFLNVRGNPDNTLQMPRPEAVIVVGLGEEGNLNPGKLIATVSQGVIAWAQRIAELGAGAPARFELAATLLGSGGAGVTPAQSARLVASGVREANEKLAQTGWPLVGRLQLVELYLDRALDAWRALQLLCAAEPGCYVPGETVEAGTGPLRRPLESNYRGAAYDLITAEARRDTRGGSIAYTLDTRRARAEVRAQSTQLNLLRNLVANASSLPRGGKSIGHTLFQLLVPIDMEPYLGGTTEMQIEVDAVTAAIPWELLNTAAGTRDGGDTRPWAIRAKLLRRLRTASFRAQVADADRHSSALVIGEPKCDETRYPRLPGARAEASAVADRLAMPGALEPDMVRRLIAPELGSLPDLEAENIIGVMLERPWRIVHIAGHGAPPVKDGDFRGVVLSNDTYLGPREICSMRSVPELVFINCCHLGIPPDGEAATADPQRYDRAEFAATVAQALIEIGVRCVVAAGWAVDDGAARVFAVTFYDALLRGERFLDAAASAREAAWRRSGDTDNTWAAYQCYGDADWRLVREGAAEERPARPAAAEAAIASPSELALVLETLAVNQQYQNADPALLIDRLNELEGRHAGRWGAIGAVAEAFGLAWAETGRLENAVAWYEAALGANDGSATLRAAEQLANQRVRLAWNRIMTAQESGLRREAANGAALNGRKPEPLAALLSAGRAEIGKGLALLTQLVAMKPTFERENLCGSAYKRLAMIEAMARRDVAEREAIEKMKQHCANAEAIALAGGNPDLFYPALNRIAAELILDAGRPGWPGFDPVAIAAIRQSLNSKTGKDPDFWSVAGLVELQLYEALARQSLAEACPRILREFEDLQRRVSSAKWWSSVRDQGEFVLLKIMRRASEEERRAALTLLGRLAEWAHSDPGRVARYENVKPEPAAASKRRTGGARAMEAVAKTAKPAKGAPPREPQHPRPPPA